MRRRTPQKGPGRDKLRKEVQGCTSIQIAERRRAKILADLLIEIDHIQNSAMSRIQIREINDYINLLLRKKQTWDERIVELGGPNRIDEPVIDKSGLPLVTEDGYYLFGAAKDFFGKQLKAKEFTKTKPTSRDELLHSVTLDYFLSPLDIDVR